MTTSAPRQRCGLAGGRRVVDPGAFELLAPFDRELLVLGAGRDQQALGRDGFPAFDLEDRIPVVEGEANDGRRDREGRPELVGLNHGAVRELGARQSRRESEVVLDAHARARLSPGGRALEHDGRESLRRAVDRGGEPARPASDDDEIVDRVLERPLDADLFGELLVGRVAQEQAAAPGDDGSVGRCQAEVLQHLVDRGIGLEVDEREEHPVAREEVADAGRVLGIARSDDLETRESG